MHEPVCADRRRVAETRERERDGSEQIERRSRRRHPVAVVGVRETSGLSHWLIPPQRQFLLKTAAATALPTLITSLSPDDMEPVIDETIFDDIPLNDGTLMNTSTDAE